MSIVFRSVAFEKKPDTFVSIISYRDPALLTTIESLLDQAKDPWRFRIVALLDADTVRDAELIARARDFIHPNVTIQIRPTILSKGVGEARAHVFNNYVRDEYFVLQLDSQQEFVKNWDEYLYNQWDRIEDPMAVLTYNPSDIGVPEDDMYDKSYMFVYKGVNRYGIPQQKSHLTDREPMWKYQGRIKTVGWCAGMSLTTVQTMQEVPIDPCMYFLGEEISYAVRLFTHGYNIYLVDNHLMTHVYRRQGRIKPLHTIDYPNESAIMDKLTQLRVAKVLGIPVVEFIPQALKNLTPYKLGKKRTYAQWRRVARIENPMKTVDSPDPKPWEFDYA